MQIAPTLTPADAADTIWPVVVIGAGPAGAVAAMMLARFGIRVLLLDRASFPRKKVCGDCVGRAAIESLRQIGCDEITSTNGTLPIDSLHLRASACRATLRIPTMTAISRERFDAALVRAAIQSGAAFLPQASAMIDDCEPACRRIVIRHPLHDQTIQAGIIIAADGVEGRSLHRLEGSAIHTRTRTGSRIGIHIELDRTPEWLPERAIGMAVTADGYIGVTRIECGRANLAGAVDPTWMKRAGGPAAAVRAILSTANLDLSPRDISERWSGTGLLSRFRTPAAVERVMLIGDCAGYVEPFTGEGIGWAVQAGVEVAQHIAHSGAVWNDELAARWRIRARRRRQWNQLPCRLIAALLRHPALVRGSIGMIGHAPGIVTPAFRFLHRPPPDRSSRFMLRAMEVG